MLHPLADRGRSRLAFAGIALWVIWLPLHEAASQTMDVGVRLWRMSPDGQLAVGADGMDGATLDVRDDLGHENAEDVLAGALDVGDVHQLSVSYLQSSASAHRSLAAGARIGDRDFAAGSSLASSLDLTLLRVAYRYRAGLDALKGGLLAGMQTVDLDVSASARGSGSSSGRFRSTLPVIGAFASWSPTPFFAVCASVTGGTWDWADSSRSFVDAEAMARLDLVPFFVGAGWRRITLEHVDTDTPSDADLVFAGPQILGGFTF